MKELFNQAPEKTLYVFGPTQFDPTYYASTLASVFGEDEGEESVTMAKGTMDEDGNFSIEGLECGE